MSEFASRAAEKLRAQGSVTGALNLFFMTSPFRQHDRQHSVSATVQLVRPTADSRLLVAAATGAVGREFRQDFNYVKAGVMLKDLQPEGQVQGELNLFAESAASGLAAGPAAKPALMTAVDALNLNFGRDSVRLVSTAAASVEVHSANLKRITAG